MKKVIIIGATSGIGKALAEHYAQKGSMVGISGRRINLLNEVQARFKENIITACFDVRKDDNINHLVSLIDKTGGVDLFIYNAGYGEPSDMPDIGIDKQVYETNVKGFIELTTYMYNYFMRQGYGQIVATSSVASNRGNSHAPAYSASKAFMSIYMEGLHMKSKRSGSKVTVTDIQPGFVQTKTAKGYRQFWVAPVHKAVQQIVHAIEKKKWRAYITKRWQLVAMLMRVAPAWLYHRLA